MRKIALMAATIVLLAAILAPPMIQAADDPIAQADILYSQRKDHANVTKGISLLEKLVDREPENYQALWRLARMNWFLGDRATEKKGKLPFFEKGKPFAERAVKANDKGIDGHYWLGSLIGAIGQEKGILNSLFMVGPMRKELDRCLEIDDKYADAHDVLAQLLWKVPGIAGGNKKKALEESRLATVYGPDATDHWLHYGQIAADLKNYAVARTALQKCLSLAGDPEDPESTQDDHEEAKAELEKIEGK